LSKTGEISKQTKIITVPARGKKKEKKMRTVELKNRKSVPKSAVIAWAVIACLCMTMAGCSGKENKQHKKAMQVMQNDLDQFKASPPVPPANAETTWPVPSEGATLYVGSSTDIPDIGNFRIGFILSADKKKIDNLTVIAEGLKYSFQRGNSVTEGSVGSLKTSMIATYSVQSPATDITFGSSKLTGLTLTGDGARAEVKYVYEANASNNEKVLVPFPSTRIVFKAVK
jgi:hypothetical protein